MEELVPDTDTAGVRTAILDAPSQCVLLAGFAGGAPQRAGLVQYHWSLCGMVGMENDGDYVLSSLVNPRSGVHWPETLGRSDWYKGFGHNDSSALR